MTSKRLRIAFGCQARTGKSTSAAYFVEKYGGTEKSFAASLYNIMYNAQEICGFEKKKNREFLQMVGTWARNQDSNVWIKSLFKDIKIADGGNIFVSDVRYPNEFEALKMEGFIMVRIISDNSRCAEDFGNANVMHESEIALVNKPLEGWDYGIENNGTLSEFYRGLDQIVENIR